MEKVNARPSDMEGVKKKYKRLVIIEIKANEAICYDCNLSSREFIHTDYEGYLGGEKRLLFLQPGSTRIWTETNLS